MRRRSPLLLVGLVAAWCALSSRPRPQPSAVAVHRRDPERVRTIVAYSQRRQQELQQRLPVSCQETRLPGLATVDVDEHSGDQWEELLDSVFRDTDWPLSPKSLYGLKRHNKIAKLLDSAVDASKKSVVVFKSKRKASNVIRNANKPNNKTNQDSSVAANEGVRKLYNVIPESDFNAQIDDEHLDNTFTDAEQRNLSWHRVPNVNIYLFSAYHDRRLSGYHYVRIISMADANSTATLYCQLWFTDSEPVVLEAISTDLWVPSWGLGEGLSPRLISCPVPKNSSVATLRGVSVAVHKPCDVGSDILPLAVLGDPQNRRDFAVCVKGLDFPDHDIAQPLVEWIEANHLLGADVFFVYVYSVHPNTQRVLDYYAARGLVHAIPITLPGDLPNDPLERSTFIRQNILEKRRNEIVPYNDCLYRNLEYFRFVVPLDVDEILVPVRGSSWKDIFRELHAEDPLVLRKYVSFSARNAYMVRQKDGGGNTLAFLSPGLRAVKSFVRTSGALAVANHYALRPRLSLLLLAPSVARLNHYRRACPSHAPECQQGAAHVADVTLTRWQPLLRERVLLALKDLQLSLP